MGFTCGLRLQDPVVPPCDGGSIDGSMALTAVASSFLRFMTQKLATGLKQVVAAAQLHDCVDVHMQCSNQRLRQHRVLSPTLANDSI